MGEVVKTTVDSWHDGVIASVEVGWKTGASSLIGVDPLSSSASPRAYNNALAIVGRAKAVPSKRPGMVTMNSTAISGESAVLGQYAYRFRESDGSVTQRHLLVSQNGRLDSMDFTGALTTINAAAFTPGVHYPDFATLSNLCFICNGVEAIKLYGGTQQVFGIVRPVIGNASGNAGIAGSLTGTFELRVTYINSVTGHESSASETALAPIVANAQAIDLIDLPVSADPQVDQRGIYLRNTATNVNFFRVDTITNTGTTATVDAVYQNLTILAPDLAENDPPPAGIKYLAAHKNRLFAADDGKLYWSKVGKPEAFDPEAFDLVHQDDRQKITGIVSIPGGLLLIFKEDSYYALDGDTPQTWTISKLGPAVGCLAHRSIVIGVDALYWYAEQGPVKLPFGSLSTPELVGADRISATIVPQALNFDERRQICAAFDITNQRVMTAVPDAFQLRNTRIMPWSSRLGVWEADRWDPIDVASMAVVNDANSQPFIMIGNYAGQIFKFGLTSNDGVPSGTKVGTFVASATSQSTITDLTATFATTGEGLQERKVTILDDDDVIVTNTIRPRITSNTATAFTLNTAVSPLVVGQTYTYHIGGIDWQFDTAWLDAELPFDKKRLEFLYVMGLLEGGDMYVDIFKNVRDDTLQLNRLATIPSSALGWDEANWDVLIWDDIEVTYDRIRGGQTGITFAYRFRNSVPDQPMTLLKTGYRAELLGDKLG